jgi:hypothetical protein
VLSYNTAANAGRTNAWGKQEADRKA